MTNIELQLKFLHEDYRDYLIKYVHDKWAGSSIPVYIQVDTYYKKFFDYMESYIKSGNIEVCRLSFEPCDFEYFPELYDLYSNNLGSDT